MDTIFVKHVKEGGPAHLAGLNPGDRIVSVNGESVTGKSYPQVISLIQSSNTSLKLLVVPKDEDILQMAYLGMYPDSNFGSRGSLIDEDRYRKESSPSYLPPYSADENVFFEPRTETKVSITLSDHRGKEPSYRIESNTAAGQRTAYSLRTSSSFGSASALYREPLKNNDSLNKSVTLRDNKSELERPVSQDSAPRVTSSLSCTMPGKTKSYTFGLYFPPPQPSDKSAGAESVSERAGPLSKENIRSPRSSENVSTAEIRTRKYGLDNRDSGSEKSFEENRSRDSTVRSQEKLVTEIKTQSPKSSSSTDRHSYSEQPSFIISRSHTASSLSSGSSTASKSQSPYRPRSEWNPSGRRGSGSLEYRPEQGVRRYVPVVSENSLSKGAKISSSVDNIDMRTSRSQTDRQWRSGNASNSCIVEQSTPGSHTRTFVVHIDRPVSYRQGSGGETQSQGSGGSPSYGTAFAVTRSPASTQKIELHNKSANRPNVSHRKKQFETGDNDNNSPGPNLNRYKTEIQKITSFSRFESVANRAAQFETKNQDEPNNEQQQSPQQLPSSPDTSSTTVQPAVKVRKISTERYIPSEEKPDRPTTLSSYQDAAPIRIYVSPGSSSAPASPIVEIVPVFQSHSPQHVTTTVRETTPRPGSFGQSVVEEVFDGTFSQPHIVQENIHGNRPVRKTSYLSAVNAPKTRYAQSSIPPSSLDTVDGPDSPDSSETVSQGLGSNLSLASSSTSTSVLSTQTIPSVMSASDSVILSRFDPKPITSSSYATYVGSAIDSNSKAPVMLRKKAGSPEEDAIKLHRRTSYLMATAKDRSNINLEKSFSPPETIPEQHVQETPARQHSLSKLKNFFGEKQTPSILEATEHKHEPDSPLSEVTKEGVLFCKSTMTDGKKSSDRSWKEVWATLRGHALFLHKEKKEGSSEQGVATTDLILRKSSQVELATGTKSSPPTSQKSKKSISFKAKLPYSPSVRRKKTEESAPKEPSSKSKGWKGRIMPRSFKKHHDDSSKDALSEPENEDGPKATFGVPLEDCTSSPNNECVPLIVELCTKIVEARGLEVVGVYRVPGNSVGVGMMQDELNKGIANMNIDNDKWLDVNVISSLLKAFFRKLPEPLITNNAYDNFIQANRISNPEKRMLKMKLLLHNLPEHHFETFKHLAQHLNRVASSGHLNKMDAKNLAIMFGPTLIRKTDDDTMRMVSDMSDQCRIVESIILHCDWFFGSWDQDFHVPTQEADPEAPSTTTETSRIPRDEDEDAESVVSTKAIVSAIINAANLKLKNKQQKSLESIDETDTYNERNIDLEISRHQQNVNNTLMSKPQSSLGSVRSSSEEFLHCKLPTGQPPPYKPPPSISSFEAEFKDWDFIDSTPDPQPQPAPFFEQPIGRHFSDDSLDKNDELEMSHGLNSSWSLSRDTLDGLRRIEQEARQIREREEQRRRDLEKHRLGKMRIEQELQRTKKELELEESHSVEDLLNWRLPEFTFHMTGKTNSPRTMEHSYSSPGSSGDRYQRPSSGESYTSLTGPPSGRGSSSSSQKSWLPENQAAQTNSSGKYFVSTAANQNKPRERATVRPQFQLGSLDSLAPRVSRAGSLENMLDSYGHVHMRQSGVPPPHRRSGEMEREASIEVNERGRHHSHGGLSRGNSLRHGSLDSLIDLYDKHDGRASWASSDSEEGSDLMTIISTFDQKLQIMQDPNKNSGNVRHSKTDSLGSRSTLTDSSEVRVSDSYRSSDSSRPSSQNLSQQFTIPNVSPAVTSAGEVSRDIRFRDPSLHRSAKSDAKIGIASRFERGSSNVAMASPVSTMTVTASQPPVQMRKPMVLDASVFKNSSLKSVGTASHPVLTQPKKLESSPKSYSRKAEFRPISKSEKTEVNATLARLSREEKNLTSFREPVSKHVTVNAESHEPKSRSESPPAGKMRSKRVKRRHTVSGVNDLEHFKALISVTGGKDDDSTSRPSAWEQLQPMVKDDGGNSTGERTLLSWIQKERLRGSTPDLLSDNQDKDSIKKL